MEAEPVTATFFDPHQRATIEAAMARMIPTDDQPGAREAGTIEFLDRYLSGLGFIYAKPDGSGFETLEGKRAEAWQGRIEILRAKYREGVAELDRRSRAEFGAEFKALAPEQQDGVLAAVERAAAHASRHGRAGAAADEHRDRARLRPAPGDAHTAGFLRRPDLWREQGPRRLAGDRLPRPDSLNEVFTGRYSTLAWFAEGHQEPQENAHG